ncbi:hypothetical protein BDR04DRAFT_1120486 [Suillus decipiens]|nr:hypothetical protein BDR04DRAFT_1120486 [Suillus decipiens]
MARTPTGKEGHALCVGTVDCESTSRQPVLNQINDDDDKDDGIFVVKYTTDSDSMCSLPALLPTEYSDDNADKWLSLVVSDDDWFLEVGEDDLPSFDDWDSQSAAPSSGSNTSSFVDLEEDVAAKVSHGHKDSAIIKLYDYSTMHHILPY